MFRRAFLTIGLFASLGLSLTGCGYTSPTQAGVVGGVSGGALGAGTGALIGSLIANGDVGESALLGGAIGIPVGIILGVAYNNYQYNSIVDRNEETIHGNQLRIQASQDEINQLRESFDNESARINPDKSRAAPLYDGPSLGQYRR